MDKSERETRDFMNVDSFSQLPFIRPTPREKTPATASAPGIRLFGIEFDPSDDSFSEGKPNELEPFKSSTTSADSNPENGNSNGNLESSRRFECHYCCRKFPTSQALGGHQNAHKRERQHAKRAHLQSAIAAHTGFSEIYGFSPYGTSPATYNSHPQWGYGGDRYFGGSSNNTNDWIKNNYYNGSTFSLQNYAHQQPINGNPLWRIPATAANANATQSTSREQLPMLGRDIVDRSGQIGRAEGVYASDAKVGMQDNVSLDLHL